jgi:hypothetical protein
MTPTFQSVPFNDDHAAFEEAVTTIRKEGVTAFANGGPNVIPFKR